MIKENEKQNEYLVRKKIQEYIFREIDIVLDKYHKKYRDDIGFLLYYPLYYFEFNLIDTQNKSIEEYIRVSRNKEGSEKILIDFIIPSIQTQKMKNLEAVSWFLKEMKKRGYGNTKRFVFDDEEFQNFKIIYNGILCAYEDYENSVNLHKLRDIAGLKLIKDNENLYRLIRPNIVDNYSKELIYFYGLFDDNFEEEKVRAVKIDNYFQQNYNLVNEMLFGSRDNFKKIYNKVSELPQNIDEKLYNMCVERVEIDIDKLGKEFKSEIINNTEELKLILGYLYYLSRVTLYKCNIQSSIFEDYRKNAIIKYDYYDLISRIEDVTKIPRESIKQYLRYFTLDEEKKGRLSEFPIIKYKNRIIFLPSSFILNDFQFTLTNGHYFKDINIINKAETVSSTLEDSIEKKIRKYSNIVVSTKKNYNIEGVKTKNGKDLKSDIDVALYDKNTNQILIIECKWKENVYIYRENYVNILDSLEKIYENQLNKHKEFIELEDSNIDFIFDFNIDLAKRKDKPKINYIFIDKRIQYHHEGKHVLSVYLFLYLISEYGKGEILFLDKLVDKINSLNTEIIYKDTENQKSLLIDGIQIKHNTFNLDYKLDVDFLYWDDDIDEDYMNLVCEQACNVETKNQSDLPF